MLKTLNVKVNSRRRRKDEIVQIDESVFCATSWRQEAYAPVGIPFSRPSRHCKVPYLACLAAVSDQRGFIMAAYKEKEAFTAENIREFIQELDDRTPWPYCVMMDNASIHVSRENLEWYQQKGIEIIRNLPFRPELMGIEGLWQIAKAEYRKQVTANLVASKNWKQEPMVKNILENIPFDEVKKLSRRGLDRIPHAMPVDPQQDEEPVWEAAEPTGAKCFRDRVFGKGAKVKNE